MSHDFCREMLRTARADAKQRGARVPVRMIALKGYLDDITIEADDGKFVFYAGRACCAFEAKSKAIDSIIGALAE